MPFGVGGRCKAETDMEPRPETRRLLDAAAVAGEAADELLTQIRRGVAENCVRVEGGRSGLAAAEQHRTHGLAWYATATEGLRQVRGWLQSIAAEGADGEAERDLAALAIGEILAQICCGVPMNQGEVIRPSAFGVAADAARLADIPEVAGLTAAAEDGALHRRLALRMADVGAAGLFDQDGLGEESAAFRSMFRKFTEERVTPHAHAWHLEDALIPAALLREMAELGVFGITVPHEYGGAGLGKLAVCVVSEELSRGYVGVGSLGTRSEIAAELIHVGGTAAQRQRWLPGIVSGDLLPAAVFTEPDVGSDLGALRTRAERTSAGWRITGAKTWITHAARANLMAVLARTDPDSSDHRGLSMFLAPKAAGGDSDPFPDPGIDGSEIPVLGYRGMKEFALSFNGFEVAADGLLGEQPGMGFRQLMQTFESARIQTAARAVGVARAALELGLGYALERRQFGKPLIEFPRVHRKLGAMAAEILVAARLAYGAARAKDAGRRCDLEAGMAKLLAARAAWTAADNALQIHGGNGFALEFQISRVLCDSRILNIFEGAAEIQADVIARRLVERR